MYEFYEELFVFWCESVAVRTSHHPRGWCGSPGWGIREFNIGLRREQFKIERRFMRRDTIDGTSFGGHSRLGNNGCKRFRRDTFFFDGGSMRLRDTR